MKNIVKIFLIVMIIGLSIYAVLFVHDNLKDVYANLEELKGKGQLINNTDNLKDSKITGENYSVDEKYNPYYTMLNDSGKKLYLQIYANIANFETTFIPVINTNTDSIDLVVESVMNDHPEFFWLGNTYVYKYTDDKIVRQIELSFNDLYDNIGVSQRKFESETNAIILEARKQATDYDKEVYVHNTLLKRIEYDKDSSYNQTAYSAVVNGVTVCAGYSKAFQYIMNRLEIPTYYVVGESNGENHAWNIVKLDGEYYNVDLTWDDVYSNNYTFFNLTDSKFASSHTRSTLSSNLPNCNATTYSYTNKSKGSTNNSNQNTKNENNYDNYIKDKSSDIEDDEDLYNDIINNYYNNRNKNNNSNSNSNDNSNSNNYSDDSNNYNDDSNSQVNDNTESDTNTYDNTQQNNYYNNYKNLQ